MGCVLIHLEIEDEMYIPTLLHDAIYLCSIKSWSVNSCHYEYRACPKSSLMEGVWNPVMMALIEWSYA
jgi:hypothetical protein